MATRTTTIRTTITPFGQSADHHGIDLAVDELLCAYYDCRKHKRTTANALKFEANLERNIMALHRELVDGSYQPGRSICFVVTRPKPREVWAADFRDRIVHHLLYNHIAQRFHNSFIADTCACIPGRGTLYGATRLESKIRSITNNWSKRAYYLKLDLANFFVSINKQILWQLLTDKITEPDLRWLASTILFSDPRGNVLVKSPPELLALIPPHKSLFRQPDHLGLPIGNLSSQFFANVYLNTLDQFIKHNLKARHYVRYVDDMVLLHEDPAWLNHAARQVSAFVTDRLQLQLNPSKTIIQPVSRGVDFVGQIIKPWRRVLRRKTASNALAAVATKTGSDFVKSANSYFGLFRQTTRSHSARARIARVAIGKGCSVDWKLTKAVKTTHLKG